MSHGPSKKPALERKPARHRRRARRFAVIFGVFALWAVAPGALIWYQGGIDGARPSACAIVLGAAAYHQKPSPVFEERIRHAVDLYGRGLVRTIVFTGGYGTGAAFAESEVGRDYAVRHGVPATSILIETTSRTTLENLTEAAELMRQNHLATAIIVSDPLHLTRAGMMAKRLGIDAVTSPTPWTRFRSWRSRLHFLARETFFVHRYLYLGY
jgi:uncharacterized SAM-binding protein YcdF (DUF218 family)